MIGSTSEEVKIDHEKNLLYRKQELIFADPNKANRTVNLTIHLDTFKPISCTEIGHKNIFISYLPHKIEVALKKMSRKNRLPLV